jgi:hypothetical protein
MNRPFRMGVAALVLASAQAMAMAAVSPDAAQDLARKSGLWVQLDSLGSQVRDGMAGAMTRGATAPAEAQRARLLDCAHSAYAPDGLRAIALDAVASTLNPADVPPLLAWYDSALGHRIAAMEEASAAQALSPQERLQRGAEALKGASESRNASLNAILVETHSVEMMADTLIEMAFAVQRGMASLDPATTPESLSELKGTLSARRPQLLRHYTQISLPAYAFTYADLGDADLKRYADHLASPGAAVFIDGTTRGVARALTAGSAKLGKCLKDAGAKS